ncbi:hypothetical protein O181_001300 [Austropuccinia psidii MF-1]|uniref:Uncharacterized protein n=1 Tax=Austropuccinia psidii MF-1 TaxID=1389203 RepID=A0A9Q3BAD2_9BASI|nr:hypothetical protein [Austropuccinia psidii MF-1]
MLEGPFPLVVGQFTLIKRFPSPGKNQGVVKRTRSIANVPTNPDGDGSDELEGEEAEVVICSTPRKFQPRLATVPSTFPHSSPNPSAARQPVFSSPIRPSPVPQFRQAPMTPPPT